MVRGLQDKSNGFLMFLRVLAPLVAGSKAGFDMFEHPKARVARLLSKKAVMPIKVGFPNGPEDTNGIVIVATVTTLHKPQ